MRTNAIVLLLFTLLIAGCCSTTVPTFSVSDLDGWNRECGTEAEIAVNGLIRSTFEHAEFAFLQSVAAADANQPGPGAFSIRISPLMPPKQVRALNRTTKNSPQVGNWWSILEVTMLVRTTGCHSTRMNLVHVFKAHSLSAKEYSALYARLQSKAQ